jgi:shikimate 5-dehydrogenase
MRHRRCSASRRRTSVGLDGGDPFGTRLIDAAARRGVATVDGLEILVAQGALSFTRFTGLAAPLDVMRAAARG